MTIGHNIVAVLDIAVLDVVRESARGYLPGLVSCGLREVQILDAISY